MSDRHKPCRRCGAPRLVNSTILDRNLTSDGRYNYELVCSDCIKLAEIAAGRVAP